MQDIIDKIRSAEKKAEKARMEAVKKTEAMLSQEKLNGRRHIDETVAEARIKAGSIIKQAEEKAEEAVKSKITAAEKESEELLRIAEGRMDRAVSEIVEGIVNDI